METETIKQLSDHFKSYDTILSSSSVERRDTTEKIFSLANEFIEPEETILLYGDTVAEILINGNTNRKEFHFIGDFNLENIEKNFSSSDLQINNNKAILNTDKDKIIFLSTTNLYNELKELDPKSRICMNSDGTIIDFFDDITSLNDKEIKEIYSLDPQRVLASECTKFLGKDVKINGWVAKIRDHGSLVFLDLRDWSGIIQLVLDKKDSKIPQKIGLEYVIEAKGQVKKREDEYINKNMPTGEIEIAVSDVEILTESLTPPFPLDKNVKNISENVRYKYRYVDIRRETVKDLIEKRHNLTMATRQWFSDNNFTEIQTPLLTVSSPEGARDFLVPSRVHQGKFYALPQAPQQYKQLLMVGGVDRYFQIAPCFRDEDPRADRHSGEFYQIDAECSFITRNQLFRLSEPYFKYVTESFTDKSLKEYRIPRLDYKEILVKYGTDKPDLRYDMHLFDLTEEFQNSEMNIFKNTPNVRAILVDKVFTKKEMETLTKEMIQEGAKGIASFTIKENALEGNISKYFSSIIQERILKKAKSAGYSVSDNQTILAFSDEYENAIKYAGILRSKMGDRLNLKNPDILAFAWIIDFPMFEWDENLQKWDFGHNPFSMPKGGLEVLQTMDPGKIQAEQFDLICNGYELASGSIRNHDPKTFIEAFNIVGYSEQETRQKFGHMIESFEYGAPPHGGFAIGFDRLMMLLFDIENIREVYAFPKKNAKELMTGAPRKVSKEDLDILGIELKDIE